MSEATKDDRPLPVLSSEGLGPRAGVNMFLPPDQPVDDRAPGDVIDDLHEEITRLRARIEAAHKACGEAVDEAVDEASKPRQKHSTWLSEPIGRDHSERDDGFKNGVQACATVVWAALTHRRV